VNGWWLLPQLAVHACFAVGAGILSGFAELTRPTVPLPEWLSDESINRFLDRHKWNDPWAEEQS
jgi:hypothetical protein